MNDQSVPGTVDCVKQSPPGEHHRARLRSTQTALAPVITPDRGEGYLGHRTDTYGGDTTDNPVTACEG